MDCVKQMEESCLWLTLEPLFWLAEMTATHSCSTHALPPLHCHLPARSYMDPHQNDHGFESRGDFKKKTLTITKAELNEKTGRLQDEPHPGG